MKVDDHRRTPLEFASRLHDRLATLKAIPEARTGFLKEMRRFLPAAAVSETLEKPLYWQYLTQLLEEDVAKATAAVS